MLTISLFLQIMRKYVGAENKSIPSFCAYFFALFMKEPISSRRDRLDGDDNYYPFNKDTEKSAAYKMYKGKRDIPESVLRAVHANLDKSRFLEAAAELPFDARKNLCADLAKYGVNCTTDNVDETCAEIFCSIIKAELQKLPGVEINFLEGRNEVGEVIPAVPIHPTQYANGSVYLLSGEIIKLHPALIPHEDINEATLPYINALCEVYSERLAKDVTPKTTGELPEKLQRHLELQRQAYFDAKSIERSVRDAFVDGERQFDALKDDAYDGIEMVYFDENHETGYVRLQEVLKKITSTELAKSNLVNIKGLITNKTRKGVCHILVDDARIKSWVNTDA